MTRLICPSCKSEMTRDEEPDLTIENCSKCGGVFLDKGELDALATGMAGDIEYLSVDSDFHKDRFAERYCPKCPKQKMEKVNLLRLSDIIFDYCPGCEGFFLDKGEIEQMNDELKTLTPDKKAEEYRSMHGDHLVRVDISCKTSSWVRRESLSKPFKCNNEANSIRVSVYFGTCLPGAIRIFQEAWPVKLSKALGLFFGQDIKTGNSKFDSAFQSTGDNERFVLEKVDSKLQYLLLEFAEKKKYIIAPQGTLEISSSGLLYIEGPYTPNNISGIADKSKEVIDALVEIADRLCED